MTTRTLTFTSCQAPSADPFCDALVRLVGRRLGLRTDFVKDPPWREREAAFDRGEIDVCWICGWPYVERADRASGDFDLLAAPVMAGSRYLGRPVYFSDIVVHADSRFQTFDDLHGASWAYNEPNSHSGFNVVRHFLASQNLGGTFFGSVVESGSHAASIELLLARAVDASAIDSTVLEAAARRRPDINRLLRVVGTIGPSPAPPWVMRSSLSPPLRNQLRQIFLTLHESEDGRTLLEQAALERFGAVSNDDYNPIREMATIGATVSLRIRKDRR